MYSNKLCSALHKDRKEENVKKERERVGIATKFQRTQWVYFEVAHQIWGKAIT